MTHDSLEPLLLQLGDALADANQPTAAFDGLAAIVRQRIGCRLFTVLCRDVDTNESVRIYTSEPEAYPVGGRKTPSNLSGWGEQVLVKAQPWLGRTHEDIAWAFFDHELIKSLGCGSAINLPVRWNGNVLGTINILDAENAYSESSVKAVLPFAPLMVPPLLLAIEQGRE
ncbi:MAG: GAF domain-containing protein [Geminicoccaceae bacterium]|nr:GAF domain-containing protein [Geminicoccaceae bacterium]MCB9945370.1 GAF domain-containing protein [Geminicoccaceae bacterium]